MHAFASPEARRDPLLQELNTICCNGQYAHVPEVLGFCCRLRHQRQEAKWSGPPPEQSLHNRLKNLVAAGIQVICGMLFLPTLRMFLDSPNDTIDIHGFGSMRGVADGLPHCCPSLATVVNMGEAGVFPADFTNHPAWSSQRRVRIPDFNYLGQKMRRKMVSVCSSGVYP